MCPFDYFDHAISVDVEDPTPERVESAARVLLAAAVNHPRIVRSDAVPDVDAGCVRLSYRIAVPKTPGD